MIEVRQNLMDRMVSAISPERGLRRMAARASLSAATALTAPRSGSLTDPESRIVGRGGYLGGQTNRRQTRGWLPRLRSANSDTLGDKRTTVARSRDAAMNIPIATAAIERPITFTVGTGLMAIPELDAQRLGMTEEAALELARQIATDHDAYLASKDADAERTATGYGLQEIVLRGVLESGDIGSIRCMPDQPGRQWETAWKLVEADRIVSPMGHTEGKRWANPEAPAAAKPKPGSRVAPDASGPQEGNVIAGGVEVDEYSAPLAYHLLRKAPDSFGSAFASTNRIANDTVRIETWGAKSKLPTFVHVMAKRRPEQFRGVSILAPVLESLKQVSDLTEAELFAAVLQAMVAIIYKSPGAQSLPEPDYGATSVEGADRGLDDPSNPGANLRLEAGTVWEIDSEAGADMETPGRPNPAFEPFFKAIVQQIAAAVEVPFEVLMLSFISSYSASRGALEVFYLTVRKRREWLASHWCTPVYECWLYEQVAKGVYKMPGFFSNPTLRRLWSSVRFRGDGKISLDPAREASAYEKREAHAWQTGAEITAELTGGDYDANVRRRIGEHKRFVDGGLPIPNAKGGGSDPASDHANAPGDGRQPPTEEA